MFPNFFFSFSSNTYDLTTLMPLTFSSTTSFKSSYLLNTLLKIGCTLKLKNPKAIATKGINPKNINYNSLFMLKAIINENTSINGVLTAILIII